MSTRIEESQYLTFLLGQEMFAIGIFGVKEILECGSMTRVPMMPSFVRGVINLRGAVVPVIDLSARFGRSTTAQTQRSCTVIIEAHTQSGNQDIGLMVDAVSEVLDIAPTEIDPAPSFGNHIRSEFIRGIAKVHGNFVITLDVNKVLSVDELEMLTEAQEKA